MILRTTVLLLVHFAWAEVPLTSSTNKMYRRLPPHLADSHFPAAWIWHTTTSTTNSSAAAAAAAARRDLQDLDTAICQPACAVAHETGAAQGVVPVCSCAGDRFAYNVSVDVPFQCNDVGADEDGAKNNCPGGQLCDVRSVVTTYQVYRGEISLVRMDVAFQYKNLKNAAASSSDFAGKRATTLFSNNQPSRCEVFFTTTTGLADSTTYERQCNSCSYCDDGFQVDCSNVQSGATTAGCVSTSIEPVQVCRSSTTPAESQTPTSTNARHAVSFLSGLLVVLHFCFLSFSF